MAEIESITTRMALALGVVGLINVQLALFEGRLHVIEVNPRASRTDVLEGACRGRRSR